MIIVIAVITIIVFIIVTIVITLIVATCFNRPRPQGLGLVMFMEVVTQRQFIAFSTTIRTLYISHLDPHCCN